MGGQGGQGGQGDTVSWHGASVVSADVLLQPASHNELSLSGSIHSPPWPAPQRPGSLSLNRLLYQLFVFFRGFSDIYETFLHEYSFVIEDKVDICVCSKRKNTQSAQSCESTRRGFMRFLSCCVQLVDFIEMRISLWGEHKPPAGSESHWSGYMLLCNRAVVRAASRCPCHIVHLEKRLVRFKPRISQCVFDENTLCLNSIA